MKQLKWVKQSVSKKAWSSFYSHQGSYCFLEEKEGKIGVGFAINGDIPENCLELNNDELMIVDMYRRDRHIYPFPLKTVERI